MNHDIVKEYYGETLQSSSDLKTDACVTTGLPPLYVRRALSGIHDAVASRYYGCGLVIPTALEGLKVLDLGCGAGRDVYALAKLVGPKGHVTGVDMTDEQLEHFRKKLLDWKQQLMEEVDRTVDHMKDDATNFPDPNDRATQEEEFSLELRTRDRERKLIKKINEAIKRIDDDEYGYCETCGIEIGNNRLEARPTAELCIDCKTLEEIRERQIA